MKTQNDFVDKLNILRFVPAFFLSGVLQFVKLWIYSLNLPIPFLGLKPNHYGSSLFMDVSEYMVENLFWALSNLTNSNLVCVMNKDFDKAIVTEEGKMEIRRVMRVNLQMDKRFFDHVSALSITKTISEVFDNPKKYIK